MAEPAFYDTESATRQVQINEWSYNNKMDTLFVFQIVFILLLFSSILVILMQMGTFGPSFMYYSISVATAIVAIIIINRVVFTQQKRDPVYWDRRVFAEDNSKKTPLSAGDPSYQTYIARLEMKGGSKNGNCECTN
jgi:hypothetical protein